MPVRLITIARNTFVESVRQPIYFIVVAMVGILQLFTTWASAFSMGMTESGEVSGDNKLMLDISLSTIFVAGMLLAAFLATAVLSREIENKTVLTVVSKPVGRPTVVLGKYLGVAAAIFIAVFTMLLFLQLALRHEVMSTAADDLDGPVILFTCLAVAAAIGAAIWGNFFYGWVFSQTATLLLCPAMMVAVALVMMISKKWALQPITTDLKPQVMMACAGVILAHMVLTAVATAASARLGQVMTIVICCAVFLCGLLSNHFIGRHAVRNDFVARVAAATPELVGHTSFLSNGDTYDLKFDSASRLRVPVDAVVYYGPNPSGAGLCNIFDNPDFASAAPDTRLSDRSLKPTVVCTKSGPKAITIRHVGADSPAASRPPRTGDYIFLQPTRYSIPAIVAWGLVPNIQFFWLTDAVSQNQPIPPSHLGLVALYAVMLIGVFLSLGVALFQTREVG